MLNEHNVFEFLFLGTVAMSFTGFYLLSKYDQWRDAQKSGRSIHKTFATNYVRRQAMLSASSKVIRKGHRRSISFSRHTQPQWLSKFFTKQM